MSIAYPSKPRPDHVFGVRVNWLMVLSLFTINVKGFYVKEIETNEIELHNEPQKIVRKIKGSNNYSYIELTPLLCCTMDPIDGNPVKFEAVTDPKRRIKSPSIKP